MIHDLAHWAKIVLESPGDEDTLARDLQDKWQHMISSRARGKRGKPQTVTRSRVMRSASVRRAKLSGSVPSSSLVQQAVDTLRKLILGASGVNEFLGSEDELISMLGVSRPTFRQAARLLEHEQLLKIKRGIGGGFFTQAPSAAVVSRLASTFLNAQGTTLLQLNDAIAPLITEAARLVATNPNQRIRAKLLEFVESHSGFEDSPDERTHVKVILAFEQLIGQLCGNPALELMINVMRDLVRNPRHGYLHIDSNRARVHSEFSKRLSRAVVDGDADMATLIVKRHVEEIRRWLPADAPR